MLTQELIELPDRLARFVTYVEQQFTELRGDITRIDANVSALQDRVERIDGEVIAIRGSLDELQGTVGELQGSVGGLLGAEYERKVSHSFASMAFNRRHNRRLRRNRLLHSSAQGLVTEFEELLSNAVERALITDSEALEVELADAVMKGDDNASEVYFVGEISITVNNNDIERAVARADILSKATGSIAWPMVIGETIPELQMARAELDEVEMMSVRQ